MHLFVCSLVGIHLLHVRHNSSPRTDATVTLKSVQLAQGWAETYYNIVYLLIGEAVCVKDIFLAIKIQR